ncbi:ABC transporter substrate-binding protein [Pseudothauera rhizosphaerae]|nr:ABC transporter substrate binding protein [Pseudothauera rhizosphaerae]
MKKLLGLLLACCTLLIAPAAAAQGTDADLTSTAPRHKAGGKWRIGYYEGGQYPDYEIILKATLRGLVALGWMEPLELPSDNNPEPGGFWAWLAKNARSDYVEFVPDAWYAAGNFDRDLRPQVRERLIRRLTGDGRGKGDIDLVIAMGTWAGQDLANDGHAVPVIVASTSDPVGAGIVKSAKDSGFDHLHAKVEPDRYARQIELFHDIIGFGKLGVVYEDSPEGRTFAAVEAIERTAAARGFEVVRCFAPFNDVPQEESERRVVACYEEIAAKADAVYLTVHRGLNANSLPQATAPLIAAELPSFSMLGETEVKRGVLMSVAQGNYVYVGHFHAETIARIFNGARPRALTQEWLAPAKIALNLKVAERIGYNPPVDILLACDEIYQAIEQ